MFIGPTGDQIRAMGDKASARRLANDAGVPTVPGSAGVLKDADEAVVVAEEIGFPVIIKATAGGGGKGMRIAHDAEQFAQLFSLAQNEALSAFGNGDVYVEKYLAAAAARRDPGARRPARQPGSIWASATARCSAATRS